MDGDFLPCDHGLDFLYQLILPLSHKSGVLCLYEPLPVSDALGDEFFEIFDVFYFFYFLFLSSLPCMGQRLQKKYSPSKRPYFAPFPGKIIRRKK